MENFCKTLLVKETVLDEPTIADILEKFIIREHLHKLRLHAEHLDNQVDEVLTVYVLKEDPELEELERDFYWQSNGVACNTKVVDRADVKVLQVTLNR